MNWYEQGYSDYNCNRSYMYFSEAHIEWAKDYADGWRDAQRQHRRALINAGKIRY